MNLLDALRGEHAILRLIIEGVARQGQVSSGPDLQAALSLMESALSSHAQIEDRLLFDQLSIRHSGILSALESMKEDHLAIRQQIGELLTAPAPSFPTRFSRFADLVLEHFAIEERVLFPLAQAAVSIEELSRLGELWSRSRGIDAT